MGVRGWVRLVGLICALLSIGTGVAAQGVSVIEDAHVTLPDTYYTISNLEGRPNRSVYNPQQIADDIRREVQKQISRYNDTGSGGDFNGGTIAASSQENTQYPGDGLLERKGSSMVPWIQFTVQELSYLVRELQLSPGLWNDEEEDYEGKLFHLYAPVAGLTDLTTEEVRDIAEMIELGGIFLSDPRESVTKVYEGVKGLSIGAIAKMMIDAGVEDFNDIKEQSARGRYLSAYYGTGLVIFVYKVVSTGGVGIIVDFSEDAAAKVRKLDQFGKEIVAIDISNRFSGWSEKLKKQFREDFSELFDGDVAFFKDWTEGMVRAWEKVANVPGAVAQALRRRVDVLTFLSRHGDDIPQSVVDDLVGALDKPIKETIEHTDGKTLSFVLDRPGRSNQVVSVHPTSSGQFKRTVYDPAYNPDLNPSIPVPKSQNGLVPDYKGTQYMHPLQGSTTVRIKLTGNRNADFAAARAELGITRADETVNGVNHTWHHMDDFEIVNGEAYSTMQLVQSSAHQGTGVTGMQHSGSAAQWRAYFGSGY